MEINGFVKTENLTQSYNQNLTNCESRSEKLKLDIIYNIYCFQILINNIAYHWSKLVIIFYWPALRKSTTISKYLFISKNPPALKQLLSYAALKCNCSKYAWLTGFRYNISLDIFIFIRKVSTRLPPPSLHNLFSAI